MIAVALIRKVAEENGWMGNMSRLHVAWKYRTFPTSDHVFQCLRFNDPEVWDAIQAEANPMRAKWIAKARSSMMTTKPTSPEDVANMLLVLRLKLAQHPDLQDKLVATGDAVIIEDCSKRQGGTGMFWGAAWKEDGWSGRNELGKLWMQLRGEFLAGRN